MKYDTRGQGGSIRVNEVCNVCSERGLWSSKPHGKKMGLAYVTLPGKVSRSGEMASHRKKHIGVFIGDTILPEQANQLPRFVVRLSAAR
ncbi:MAG: hypothetical protein J5I93_17785 [Pirellulaceae bacterium]|nr:hypothetical protein [Pirellulaceae bacterium]